MNNVGSLLFLAVFSFPYVVKLSLESVNRYEVSVLRFVIQKAQRNCILLSTDKAATLFCCSSLSHTFLCFFFLPHWIIVIIIFNNFISFTPLYLNLQTWIKLSHSLRKPFRLADDKSLPKRAHSTTKFEVDRERETRKRDNKNRKEKQTDRQTDRERATDRQTDRDRDREKMRKTLRSLIQLKFLSGLYWALS